MTAPLFAGIGGHHKTNEWLTPPYILDALGGWESFDLDPCAPAVRPWPTARQHYTAADNGLIKPWQGRVFLNPPYSTALLSRFMARMAAHGRGMALIFARTETDSFFRHVWEAASALLFIEGRLNFHRPDGSLVKRRNGSLANSGAPSVLCAYGPTDAEILASADIAGAFVPLALPRTWAVLIAGASSSSTWREAVLDVLRRRPGPVKLAEIYRAIAAHPKAQRNRHYQAKVRQVLQQGPFRRVAPGVWILQKDAPL